MVVIKHRNDRPDCSQRSAHCKFKAQQWRCLATSVSTTTAKNPGVQRVTGSPSISAERPWHDGRHLVSFVDRTLATAPWRHFEVGTRADASMVARPFIAWHKTPMMRAMGAIEADRATSRRRTPFIGCRLFSPCWQGPASRWLLGTYAARPAPLCRTACAR